MDGDRAESKTIGKLKISLPEGARFPLITGPNGIRWTLSDTERSDSLAEVSVLRISPDETKVAFVVVRPNQKPILYEVELATNHYTARTAFDIYDAVYLPDGKILASVLENEQPRKAVLLGASQTVEIAVATAEQFITLSLSNPAEIKIRSWNGTTQVVLLGDPKPPSSVEASKKFGCAALNDLLPTHARCEQKWISSSEGVAVPISVVIPNPSPKYSPVYLRVYGAYGLSVGTSLARRDLYLLNHGITVAFVHVRGGGELGPAWHAAGRGANRSNSVIDLERAIQHFDGRPSILIASSAGAINAIGSLVNASNLIAGVILESPLLDLDAILAKFPDDIPEFGSTPAELYPFEVITRIKPLPPLLVLCSDKDPLIDVAACERFATKAEPRNIETLIFSGDRHDRAWSRTDELELDSKIIAWIFKRITST